jgi:hypothetical protein
LGARVLSLAIVCNERPAANPLTRPAPADESAVAGTPLPQGGEGHCQGLGGTGDEEAAGKLACSVISVEPQEPRDHEVCAQDDSAGVGMTAAGDKK